jgi:nucleoside-diphosphate-sugar epimerase
MDSVLVTGATGFVGRALVRTLSARGAHLRVLVRKMPAIPPPDSELLLGDLSDQNFLASAMKGCDGVVHLAAYARNWARDPRQFDEINIAGTERLLGAALTSGVRRVVHTSTVLTIGPSDGTPLDESAPRTTPPQTDYERTKIAGEQIVQEFVRKGLDVVMVNPTRIFGPGPLTEANSVSIMVRDYINGRWHMLPGDGTAVGNYAFVEDVAAGVAAALIRGRTGERYILGGENLSYRDFFKTINNLTGESHFLVPLPTLAAGIFSRIELLRATLFNGHPLITPGWVTTLFGDAAYSCAKAERELGYQVTPFATAMRATIDWLRNTSTTVKEGT